MKQNELKVNSNPLDSANGPNSKKLIASIKAEDKIATVMLPVNQRLHI
jgi:hypothetical protein